MVVRTDESVARASFRFSQQWKVDAQSGRHSSLIHNRRLGVVRRDGERFVLDSLSGNERNHLFLNRAGRRFVDVSPLSGMDTSADRRTFVLWDYDRDGWQDVALVNANAPRLNIFRNEIARDGADRKTETGKMIALRFIGGNDTAQPSGRFACRAGYGAVLTVTAGDLRLIREHRCGEGMGGQNSDTMIVGIGGHAVADEISVRWPSTGAVQRLHDVPAGTMLTVYEDPTQSPQSEAFVSTPYRLDQRRTPSSPIELPPVAHDRFVVSGLSPPSKAVANRSPTKLFMYTTTATWCVACIEHLPQSRLLRATFGADHLEMVGVPIDENDDAAKLAEYVESYQPPYRMFAEITSAQRAAVSEFFTKMNLTDVLPATVVTDAAGRVLLVVGGVPSVSELRKAAAQ